MVLLGQRALVSPSVNGAFTLSGSSRPPEQPHMTKQIEHMLGYGQGQCILPGLPTAHERPTHLSRGPWSAGARGFQEIETLSAAPPGTACCTVLGPCLSHSALA